MKTHRHPLSKLCTMIYPTEYATRHFAIKHIFYIVDKGDGTSFVVNSAGEQIVNTSELEDYGFPTVTGILSLAFSSGYDGLSIAFNPDKVMDISPYTSGEVTGTTLVFPSYQGIGFACTATMDEILAKLSR